MDYPQEHIKPYGEDGKKSEQVEEMFDNIAPQLAPESDPLVKAFPTKAHHGRSHRYG